MANTYSQIHIHFVFAVKYRERLISGIWKNSLYKYITGIVQSYDHKLLIINGMPDHIHIMIGLRPTQSVSELMQKIKGMSSKWINEQNLVKGKFEWQEGYGAFSYSKSQLPAIMNYIENQEEHHKSIKFTDEYRRLLNEAGIDFDEKFVFKEPE